MLGVNAFEIFCYLGEGLVPADAFPTAGSAAHGMLEAIFVVVNILQSNRLGADVAVAERIVFVPTDV